MIRVTWDMINDKSAVWIFLTFDVLKMSSSKDKEQVVKRSKETFAYKFWQEFQEERGGKNIYKKTYVQDTIQGSMNELSQKSRSSIPSLCDGLLQRISELEKKTTDASRFLPPYDQRQSILAELTPKNKFSFKSRKTTGSTEKSVSAESNKIINNDLEVVTSHNEIVPTITSLNQNFQTVTLDNKQNCYISVKSYLTNLEKSEEKVMDFQISNLDHCIVNLVNSNVVIGAIHIKGLKDTIIMAGPVRSSILIYDCERCVFLIGCHQFRMHTSRQMTIYLHTTSHPIIEDCHNILFAPYTLSIPGLGNMFEAAKLDQNNNKSDKVEDFNWLKQQASPNWRTVSENKILKDWPFLHTDDSDGTTEETVSNVLNEILESQLIS
ncbi:15581_t:CDS:2 [Cetraspora pellucida]|uniref:15581_t:CDS:1 n=1 Tax=Cetraspora pellucida TaxID=1433469 RepID=A0A9N8ZBA4_9GLOM|nr:15581_t:CDS:2 [Cetraspora pellucida]